MPPQTINTPPPFRAQEVNIMAQSNKKVWWIDKAVWVMLLAYVIGILYLYVADKEANLFAFLNTMTLLFILGMLIAIAYMLAMRE
jgi:hypothetical protein